MAGVFNGSTSLVNLGNVAAINGATVLSAMAWIFPTSDADMSVFAKGNNVSPSWDWSDEGAAGGHEMHLNFRPGNNASMPSGVLTLNAWQSVAFAYNGAAGTNADKLQMYVNKVAQALSFEGAFDSTFISNSQDLVIGNHGVAGALPFTGRIAHVKMWTAHLSAAQIALEHQARKPLITSNLLFYVPMFNSDAVFKDFGPNKVALSLTAMSHGHGPPA